MKSMRKMRQALSILEALDCLRKASSGVLAYMDEKSICQVPLTYLLLVHSQTDTLGLNKLDRYPCINEVTGGASLKKIDLASLEGGQESCTPQGASVTQKELDRSLEACLERLALAYDCAHTQEQQESIVASLYFHSAAVGAKVQALKQNQQVSFAVINQDCVAPARLTTDYRSVLVSGYIDFDLSHEEKFLAMQALGARFCQGYESRIDKAIAVDWNHLAIYAVRITEISGKESSYLATQRRQG